MEKDKPERYPCGEQYDPRHGDVSKCYYCRIAMDHSSRQRAMAGLLNNVSTLRTPRNPKPKKMW